MSDGERAVLGDVVTAGVDWITATARAGRPAEAMQRMGDRHLALAECQGLKPFEARSHGYQLVGCGDVRLGVRDEDTMVSLAGETARGYWEEVARVATNVSRLDLQTTVRFDPPDEYLAEDHYRALVKRNRELRRPVTIEAQLRDVAYQTVYVGARANDTRARIYDKGAQSKDAFYAGCWRYEVQYRDDYAGWIADALLQEQDVPGAVASSVSEYLKRRAVDVRYYPGEHPGYVPMRRKESSDARRLRWLAEQVYATVRDLEQRGRGEDAYAALGVPHELLGETLSIRRSRGETEDGERVLHPD